MLPVTVWANVAHSGLIYEPIHLVFRPKSYSWSHFSFGSELGQAKKSMLEDNVLTQEEYEEDLDQSIYEVDLKSGLKTPGIW